MKRNHLKKAFAHDFASTAFTFYNNEPIIQGKFGHIAQLGTGEYDAWFVWPDLSPLSGRKLAAIERKAREIGQFTKLEGEGYIQGQDPAFVRKIAPIIGIRKRRKVSSKEQERLRIQIVAARAE